MSERLKNILSFTNLAAGASIVLPHGLNTGATGPRPLAPDIVYIPSPDLDVVSADTLNVTILNTGAMALSGSILVEAWHTIERAFNGVQNTDLPNKPYVVVSVDNSPLVSNSSYSAVYNPYAPEQGNSFQTLQAALAFAWRNQPGQRVVQFDNTRNGTGVALAGPVGAVMTLSRDPSNPIPFAADMVGSNVYIDGAANTPNIGLFAVSAFIDINTLEYINLAGVAEPAFNGSWQVVGAAGVVTVDIPPDDYDFTGVELYGVPSNAGQAATANVSVRILDGVHRWSGLRKIGGELMITNLVNLPNPSPIKVTGAILFEFGLADTGDFSQLVNTGTTPFIDASSLPAGQSLTLRMGGRFGGANPSVGFGAGAGTLNTNNGQFGGFLSGAISGTNPAAIFNITNVGVQSEISNMKAPQWAGLVQYGAQAGNAAPGAGGANIPRNRMQMFPFSVGQAAPAASAVAIVNSTGLGHNGSYFVAPPGPGALAQKLPLIRSMTLANGLSATTPGALNSTGISVEFNNVGVAPLDISADNAAELIMASPTLPGGVVTFRIQPGCSAVFRSDGVSNWRLIGYAPGAPSAAYLPTNVTPDRAFDAPTVLVAELADVVGTMIADLQAKGILG